MPKTETNYYARIRNPIDLGMMKKRALVGCYDEPTAPADDDASGAAAVSSSQPLDDSQAWAPEEDDGGAKAASSSASPKPAALAVGDSTAPRGIQGLWEGE